MNRKLVESLGFYSAIQDEVDRLQNVELPVIQGKLDRVTKTREEVEDKITNFNQHYLGFE
jgi:hypothetical protein